MTDEERQILALEKIKLFREQHGQAASLPDDIVALLAVTPRAPKIRQPMTVGQFVVAMVILFVLFSVVRGLGDSMKEADQATADLRKSTEQSQQMIERAERELGRTPAQ